MTTSINSTRGAGSGLAGTSERPAGTTFGNSADDLLYEAMAQIEEDRDRQHRNAVGAAGSGNIFLMGKVLRESQRQEGANEVLLRALEKNASKQTENAKNVNIAK